MRNCPRQAFPELPEPAKAENANIVGNPVLSGGRFDTAARAALGNNDVGAIALNAQAAVHTVPTISQAVYKGVAYDIQLDSARPQLIWRPSVDSHCACLLACGPSLLE